MKKLLLLFLFSSLHIEAQQITSIAGNGISGYTGDGGPAVLASFSPSAIAVDLFGNVYISDQIHNCVRKINTSGIISTIAGNGTVGYSGDGGPAISAQLNKQIGITVDAIGNLYIADSWNSCVRKVNTSGVISTIAGINIPGYSGDSGPAIYAQLNFPDDVAIDALGNVYISDFSDYCIRKINVAGIITTIAGDGNCGYIGDGGPASLAEFVPNSISVDASGNLFIADGFFSAIRKINSSGIISTIAGNGIVGFSGDGGSATSSEINSPENVATDTAGNVYISDEANNRVRKIDISGIITTMAGNGISGYLGDGGPATLAEIFAPGWIKTNSSGDIYIADGNCRIRRVTNSIPNTIWGNVIFTGSPISDSTCKVWLIKYDSSTTTLTAVDSTTTCMVSNVSFYEFIGKPNGNYLIKAALLSAPDSGTGYVSTYHSSSFYWDSATYVNHIGGNDGPENITLNFGILTGGPGFIAGNVFSGANKGTAGPAPVSNMLVLLRNNVNNLVAFAYTDFSGNFSFSNLANGSYNIFPVEINYATIPSANLGINSLKDTIAKINFSQHTLSFTITPDSVMNNSSQQQSIEIYPNPTNNLLTIASPNNITKITITNLLGQTVYSQGYNSTNAQISVAGLPFGLYFIKVNDLEVRKFVKE